MLFGGPWSHVAEQPQQMRSAQRDPRYVERVVSSGAVHRKPGGVRTGPESLQLRLRRFRPDALRRRLLPRCCDRLLGGLGAASVRVGRDRGHKVRMRRDDTTVSHVQQTEPASPQRGKPQVRDHATRAAQSGAEGRHRRSTQARRARATLSTRARISPLQRRLPRGAVRRRRRLRRARLAGQQLRLEGVRAGALRRRVLAGLELALLGAAGRLPLLGALRLG